MKKRWLRSIFLIVITIFLLWYILKDNFDKSINILFSANIIYLILAIIMYAIYFLFEALILKKLIAKYDKKYSFKKALELNIMTKFFNGITPFSMGGQPLQVYELNKDGIKISESTLVIVENFILFQVVMVSLVILAFIGKFICHINPSSVLWISTIVGFVLNTLLLIIVTIICININFALKSGNAIIKLMVKMKLIKNKEKAMQSWEESCAEYSNGFRNLINEKKLVFECILLEIFEMFFLFLVPIFVFKSLGFTGNINIIYSLILSTFVFIVGSYIPLPGGTMGTEYAFINYFDLFVSELLLSPAVILWRFLTYYFPMLIGAIVFNIRKMRYNKGNK